MGITASIDISAEERQFIVALINKHLPNTQVWAFGSRVKWTTRSNSDLDLVAFSIPQQDPQISALKEAFEESNLPFRVDLLVWDNLPENFKQNIQECYQVLVEDKKVEQGLGLKPNWLDMELGQFIELKRGYDLPKNNRETGSVPLVSSSGESDFHSVAKVSGPGVVTGRYGTIGKVFYIEDDFWPLNTTLYVQDFKGNDPLFVYYFLKTISYSDYSDKAAVPGINRNHLHKAQIRVPIDPFYQRELAQILWGFDKKIELNRQTNQTLEQIAQAIFKSWFVDFEPVKAKMAAKQAGASAEQIEQAAICAISGKTPEQLAQLAPQTLQQLKTTAALFPDAFVDSELGEIPEGWSVGCIGDISNVKAGYAFKGDSFIDEGNPVVKIKNITGKGEVELNGCQCIDDNLAKNAFRFKLNDGDLLMAMTGATVAKTGIVVTEGRSVYLNQRVAKFESDKFGSKVSWFLYCCFERDSIFDSVVGAAQGSAQPNISSSGIESTELILPNDELIELFCNSVDSLFRQWIANISENSKVIELRDSLLPKLLSGEINLSNLSLFKWP